MKGLQFFPMVSAEILLLHPARSISIWPCGSINPQATVGSWKVLQDYVLIVIYLLVIVGYSGGGYWEVCVAD